MLGLDHRVGRSYYLASNLPLIFNPDTFFPVTVVQNPCRVVRIYYVVRKVPGRESMIFESIKLLLLCSSNMARQVTILLPYMI